MASIRGDHRDDQVAGFDHRHHRGEDRRTDAIAEKGVVALDRAPEPFDGERNERIMIEDTKVDIGVHPGQVLRLEPESPDQPGQVVGRIRPQRVAARTTDFVGMALADDLVCVVAQDRPARIGNRGIDRVAESVFGGRGGHRRSCGGVCH